MNKRMPTTTGALTRRDFIAITGAAWAATYVPLAWSSTTATTPSLAGRSWAGPHVERYRTNVEGLWRTHAWHSDGGAHRLELSILGNDNAAGWAAAPVPEGFIQMSGPNSLMPQHIHCDDLSRGIGLAEIRRDFGEGVLQELLEEIRYRA